MKTVNRYRHLYAVLALLVLPISALAQPGMMSDEQRGQMMNRYPGAYGPAWGMGPGMMGGWGPGAGWGPGMMGPGMMGPGMMGPGMMGPGMMGPGMMGPGMMGGPGTMMGPGGMMGFGAAPGMAAHALYWLDLTDKQRAEINDIQEQAHKRQWKLYGELIDAQAKLNDLYLDEQPDPKQIGQIYGNVAKVQQQMAEIGAETHNRMLGVLTQEQREELRQWHRRMFGAAPRGDHGPGGGPNR